MLIIDRLEGSWAIIEYDDKTFKLPVSLLPQQAKEGDVIQMQITLDKKATKTLKQANQTLMDDIFID